MGTNPKLVPASPRPGSFNQVADSQFGDAKRPPLSGDPGAPSARCGRAQVMSPDTSQHFGLCSARPLHQTLPAHLHLGAQISQRPHQQPRWPTDSALKSPADITHDGAVGRRARPPTHPKGSPRAGQELRGGGTRPPRSCRGSWGKKPSETPSVGGPIGIVPGTPPLPRPRRRSLPFPNSPSSRPLAQR